MTARTPHMPAITQGAVSREIRGQGVTLTETVHEGNLELAEHRHREASLTVVLGGGFEERFGATGFDLRPLQGLYKPPGARHSNRYGPQGARSLLVALDREAHRRLERFAPRPAGDPVELGGALAARALALYASAGGTAGEASGWEELFAALLAGDAARLGRESRRPGWLGRVEAAIRERFGEPLRLGLLAEEAEVHPVHLARVYRRFHGCSVGDALRRRRVEHAVRRLLDGRQDPALGPPAGLAHLAVECGFADQSHLTRAFRRETGVSPARFRRRVGGVLDRS